MTLPERDEEAQRASDQRHAVRTDEPVTGGPVRRVWRAIGPGVITGAADDDPSGIATYSVAGAQFGTALLWTALLTWPLMAAVQNMCARIGMITGRGLMGALRQKIPRPVLVVAAGALFAANTINVGPDWRAVLHDTVVPSLPHGGEMWGMLVAILGTTISPYLFFWQASQEVEEEKSKGRRRIADRVGATTREIRVRRLDVGAGTLFLNLVMYFIILATAITLHHHGLTHPETSRDAATALTPLA